MSHAIVTDILARVGSPQTFVQARRCAGYDDMSAGLDGIVSVPYGWPAADAYNYEYGNGNPATHHALHFRINVGIRARY